MLRVEPIDLNVTFPSDWIRVVTIQPHVHLTTSKPYRWPENRKSEQIAGINRTLEIAKVQQAHFTLFPEYSIPGLVAVDLISNAIADENWSNGSIVIGGVDGLTKNEYEQLCQQPNTIYHANNAPDHVTQNKWINCSVTWVKDDNGQFKKYIQPKICPAWSEKNIQWAYMFRGKAIYIFIAKYNNNFPCRFVSFICFDWIGKIDGLNTQLVDRFLHSYNTICGDNPNHLHWVFILQENDEPNHDLFIRRTSDFLTERTDNPMVDRVNSAIILVNNSGKTWRRITDTNRAFTSCVFPETHSLDTTGSPDTISFASTKIRGKTINRCKDILFREQRPCIHSFNIRVTQFLDLTQESRCHPIENASVHPLDEHSEDPRFPDGPVPACVKWVNDELDSIQSLETRYPQTLPSKTHESHEVILGKLRRLPANRQQDNVHYATASHSGNDSDNFVDADSWDTQERQALEHLLHTTTIFRIANNEIDLEDSKLHARTTIDGKLYEIVAIRGREHPDCKRHFDKVCMIIINHPILLVSRNVDNRPYTQKFSQKITKVNQLGTVSDIRFADPSSGIIQKGYSDLLDIYTSSQDEHSLGQELIKYVA